MKIRAKFLVLIAIVVLLGASQGVMVDHTYVGGPPMKLVVVSGAYVDAIALAYADWNRRRPASVSILNQRMTISPEPGTHLLYIHFVPNAGPEGYMVGGSTIYGRDILYTIDLAKRKIVRTSYPQ
jgi:hypothetical protein